MTVLLVYDCYQFNNWQLTVIKGQQMASNSATVTTSVNSRSSGKKPAEAKQALYAKGVTLSEFASKNGFKYRTVSEVVRGVNKGLYGEGHRVAVALGIK